MSTTETNPIDSTTGQGPVLEIENLHVGFPTDDGVAQAVRGVSLSLQRGEALGIVGESGSGKSVTSMAVMGLLPGSAKVTGSAKVLGQEMVGLDDSELSKVRGNRIAMIFQDPLTSLNPVYTVGYQLAEAVLAHHKMSKRAAHERAVELLDIVGIPNPRQRADAYPHELSGGMRQRVVIGIAMANDPDVIIADEPTTALDVTVQAQVMEALELARKRTNAALMLITHDLGVIAGHVDRVGVMYAGTMVESGTVQEVFYESRMPYTLGLIGSLPRTDEERGHRLTPINGTPPSLVNLPPGCPFAPRCPMATDLCHREEPLLFPQLGDSHAAACHYSDQLEGKTADDLFTSSTVDVEAMQALANVTGQDTDTRGVQGPGEAPPILRAEGLVKHFPVRSKGILRRKVGDTHAVCDVSLEVSQGETLALVGESGCGKSTTARLLLQLLSPTAGEVYYEDRPLSGLSRTQLAPLRADLQIVFQDPLASLDPRMNIAEIIAEPLRIHGRYSRGGRSQVRELLSTVGLNPEHANRYPHEFSGGQRQRIGIARALALRPRALVLDEPVSALDVSIQAGVINLLEDLQEQLDLAYVFVSHDLSVVRHISHRVAVMYLGKVVETGTTEALFTNAAHPYTQVLGSAIPIPDPIKERSRERIMITGDVPSPADPPSGCRFRTRCPKFANQLSPDEQQQCITQEPELMDRGQGHASACHFAEGRPLV
ncbi:ABC transporter ATP-binding protein [Lipingzhangella sp. LS1_29]|uniref:ABC transporter ATP-binding protein n=1 Tax=Lipingzhangella rawalii TaxID=2055835 RepID=A0ABU2H399_9ACTN|nr:ABC transporter ATP-binding protein [Lipingzhangella rawalii]MDS1269771.1 ABC transporter ATP-binding protein [Lipingzhangella rawalii]